MMLDIMWGTPDKAQHSANPLAHKLPQTATGPGCYPDCYRPRPPGSGCWTPLDTRV